MLTDGIEMRKLHFIILGCFLFTVRAEEESQGYRAEQTKGTTVTTDLLLKPGNTTGHGTGATTVEERAHQHTAAAAPAKFPGMVVFDARATRPYERIQIATASAVIASQSIGRSVSTNGRKSLTPAQNNPSRRQRNQSETPLISDYEKIVYSSPKAEFESMMTDSAGPELHLPTDVTKASSWLRPLLNDSVERNTDSLISVDRESAVPVLSASRPLVIDNPGAPHINNDGKQFKDKHEKGISDARQKEHLFSTIQSIFRNPLAQDSARRSAVTNLCLTCRKDRKASTEKSAALPGRSPDASAPSLGTGEFALDFNQFTNSMPHLQTNEEEEERMNKGTSRQDISKRFGMKEPLIVSLHKTTNESQNMWNNSQIKAGTFVSKTQFSALMSPVTHEDAAKQMRHIDRNEPSVSERPSSTARVFYTSALSLHTFRKPVKNGEQTALEEKMTTGEPLSPVMYFSVNNKNISQSLSLNFRDTQSRPLDLSGGSVNNTPVNTGDPQSGRKTTVASDQDPSMRLIEARSTTVSIGGSSTSAGGTPESHALTRRDESSIPFLKRVTLVKPNPQTREQILTFGPKDPAFVNTEDQTFKAENSIYKESTADPGAAAVQETQTLITTTRTAAAAVPEKLFLSESIQKIDNQRSVLRLATVSSRTLSYMTGLLGTLSKITKELTSDVSVDSKVAPIKESHLKNNKDLISLSEKEDDGHEEVLMSVKEDEERENVTMEGRQGRGLVETLLVQDEEQSRDDKKLETEKEELFRFYESERKDDTIYTGLGRNPNPDREGIKLKTHKAKTNKEDDGDTASVVEATLSHNKESRRKEARDKEEKGAGGKGTSKINTQKTTEDISERQSETQAKAKREETAGEEDIIRNRETRGEDVTNVLLGPVTNSEKVNRDAVTDPSSCHSLIKQCGATEHGLAHPSGNVAKIVEMKNNPFSYEVTGNHRTLPPARRYESPKRSGLTPPPIKRYTGRSDHTSTHGSTLTKHRDSSSLAKESTGSKVVDDALSLSPKLHRAPQLSPSSEFGNRIKPALGGEAKSKQSDRNTNVMSISVAPATAHLRVNTASPRESIIDRISDHRNTFHASVSKADFHIPSEKEQTENIIEAHTRNVKGPLMSDRVEDEHSVNPTLPLQTYNDSSTQPPTPVALSSEDRISAGRSLPHQGHSVPQISQSSSSSTDTTSGQPHSLELSRQTTRLDAFPVEDNEQRSAQTLMASMSPKAKHNQFLLSGTSAPLSLMLFGGDSLPATYRPTELTRSASDGGIFKATAEYADRGVGRTEHFLVTPDDTNQKEEHNNVPTTATLPVTKLDAVTKQMEGNGVGKDSGGKQHAKRLDGFSSSPTTHGERPVVRNTTETIRDDSFQTASNNKRNKMTKTSLGNNHKSQIDGYIKSKTTDRILQTSKPSQDFTPTTNPFVIHLLDPSHQRDTFVESESENQTPQTQYDAVTNCTVSDVEHDAAKTTEKHKLTERDNSIPAPHGIRGDLKVSTTSSLRIAERIMNVFPESLITTSTAATAAANDFVSLASASSPVALTGAHESVPATSQSKQIVNEKSSHSAHAEHTVLSHSPIASLSPRDQPTTSGRVPPAVKRHNTAETQSMEQLGRDFLVRAIKQNQHVPPGMITAAPLTQPVRGERDRLMKAAHRVERTHDRAENSFEGRKGTLITSSAFKVRDPQHERTGHSTDGSVQHETRGLLEDTSTSQVTLESVGDSVPPTGISLGEILNKSVSGTIDFAKSGQTAKTTTEPSLIDHGAVEEMFKTEAGTTRRDPSNAAHTSETKPKNRNCSTNFPREGKADPQVIHLAGPTPAFSKSNQDATADWTVTENAESMTNGSSAETEGALIKADHLERGGRPERLQLSEQPSQTKSHKQSSEAQEVAATEVTVSEPDAASANTNKESTERTLHTGNHSKTQLNRGAAKAEIFEAENDTRSASAAAKGAMTVQESGHRLLLQEMESESRPPRLNHRRRTSSLLLLYGVTQVPDEPCGRGNYSAEMSLNLMRLAESGDAASALANVSVAVNLKTNNSGIDLQVTSCCVSVSVRPDSANATCCLFSRLAAEPAGLMLPPPSAVSTSAGFASSLLQMINYSVVYLHCDLSVCPRNRSDCERQCIRQRSSFPLTAAVTNPRNRSSFGSTLRDVMKSTFTAERERSRLHLVLVTVSLVAAPSFVTVALLMALLARRRRAICLLRPAASPTACCCRLRRGRELIPA